MKKGGKKKCCIVPTLDLLEIMLICILRGGEVAYVCVWNVAKRRRESRKPAFLSSRLSIPQLSIAGKRKNSSGLLLFAARPGAMHKRADDRNRDAAIAPKHPAIMCQLRFGMRRAARIFLWPSRNSNFPVKRSPELLLPAKPTPERNKLNAGVLFLST